MWPEPREIMVMKPGSTEGLSTFSSVFIQPHPSYTSWANWSPFSSEELTRQTQPKVSGASHSLARSCVFYPWHFLAACAAIFCSYQVWSFVCHTTSEKELSPQPTYWVLILDKGLCDRNPFTPVWKMEKVSVCLCGCHRMGKGCHRMKGPQGSQNWTETLKELSWASYPWFLSWGVFYLVM